MSNGSGLLDTSSFGSGAKKPGPDNLNRPAPDGSLRRPAPPLGSIGVSAGDDAQRRSSVASAELERNTHPERYGVERGEDSGVEGSEHLGSDATSERDERE